MHTPWLNNPKTGSSRHDIHTALRSSPPHGTCHVHYIQPSSAVALAGCHVAPVGHSDNVSVHKLRQTMAASIHSDPVSIGPGCCIRPGELQDTSWRSNQVHTMARHTRRCPSFPAAVMTGKKAAPMRAHCNPVISACLEQLAQSGGDKHHAQSTPHNQSHGTKSPSCMAPTHPFELKGNALARRIPRSMASCSCKTLLYDLGIPWCQPWSHGHKGRMILGCCISDLQTRGKSAWSSHRHRKGARTHTHPQHSSYHPRGGRLHDQSIR